jgi:lipopolysaccharide/colanic/teichoic acid biosynthesis glycosyltransferase
MSAVVPRDPRPAVARRIKRAFDLIGALFVLVVASPLLALACVAIRIESRGSPIYRQRRVGKGGVDFDLLKLRTMVSGAEQMGKGLAVDEGDPRITRVGAALRRISLDELPNLLNVVRGEMSLIGNRAGPLVHRALVAAARCPHRRCHAAHAAERQGPLPRRDGRLALVGSTS